MPALNWVVFGVVILVITSGVVWLAHLTARALGSDSGTDGKPASETPLDDFRSGSRRFLYGNVVVSHGLFGGLVVLVAWVSNIPIAAFSFGELSPTTFGIGMAVGFGLFGVSETGKVVLSSEQLVYSEHLRELLAPTTPFEWIGLLVVVLPVVAGVEKLLFRGALIGAFAFGFGVAPWILAVFSSVVFGIGHGIQGRAGIIATGLLGGLLAAVFIVTNSLIVVIIAHYVVNALEFVVHEYILDRAL
jgi:membrane protease YdiL (CAAX protease family)